MLKFAKAVNAGDYDEKTDAVVVLDADLDLSGVEWTPIGQANASGDIEHCFSGKFYGNGHVISNLDFLPVMEKEQLEVFLDTLKRRKFQV